MKNYFLFSTNVHDAIDNVSIVIKTDLNREAAVNIISNTCKYSSFTVSPIGAPTGDCVDFDDAIKMIESLKLHVEKFKLDDTKTRVIKFSEDLSDHIDINMPDNIPIISLKTKFKSDDATLMAQEVRFTKELSDMFKLNIAYYKTRSEFLIRNYNEAIPNDKPKQIIYHKFVACDNRLIELMDIYKSVIVKI